MKNFLTATALFSIAMMHSACDPQSGITKKSLEKYGPTPTPSISPTPTEAPIDPADVVTVDTTVPGATINMNPGSGKKAIVCDKFNRLMVNGIGQTVTVKGACSQVIVNGNNNEITAEAATEIVFNGNGNTVRYTRYVNGKRPTVSGNSSGNTAEKIASETK